MTSNIDLVMRSLDAWRRRDADALAATFAEDAVLHEHATQRTVRGADAIAANHLAWTRAFPDVDGDLGVVVGEGRVVAYQITWSGTQTGELPLPDGTVVPATGRNIRIPAAMFMVLVDGLIVEQHHHFDALTMLGQLGAMPGAGAGDGAGHHAQASTSV
jgi:steroid delta-isomerase-like uncharacterized protein